MLKWVMGIVNKIVQNKSMFIVAARKELKEEAKCKCSAACHI